MGNTNDYIKTLFHQDIKVSPLNNMSNDMLIHLKKGTTECYDIVRDTLTKNINGSCIYGIDGDTVYFTLSKHDAHVVEKVAKKISNKKNIWIESVDFNPYKFKYNINDETVA